MALMLEKLPVEILLNIFQNLTLKDLSNLMCTSKYIHNLIKCADSLWKIVGGAKYTLIYDTLCFGKKGLQTREKGYEQCRISRNWCKGFYNEDPILCHNVNYIPWTFLNKELLFISEGLKLNCFHRKNGVILWSSECGRCEKNDHEESQEHNRSSVSVLGIPNKKSKHWSMEVKTVHREGYRINDITRFLLKDQFLVCGNRDGCVTIYESNTCFNKSPKLKYFLQNCHDNGDSEVTTVDMLKGNCHVVSLLTGSRQSKAVKLWRYDANHSSFVCYRKTVMQQADGVTCLQLSPDNDRLISCLNGNSKPMLIDVESGHIVINMSSVYEARHIVRDAVWYDANLVLFTSQSGVVYGMDTRSGHLVHVFIDPFLSPIYCVKTDGNHAVLSGSSQHSRCVLYDNRKTSHTQLFFTKRKQSPVYSLEFDSNMLVVAADRRVSILDFSVKSNEVVQHDFSPEMYGFLSTTKQDKWNRLNN